MTGDQNPAPPPPPAYGVPLVVPTAPSQGMAITSMVLGIVSVFLFWVYAIVPILAIIFGGVSMSQAKKAGAKSSGVAIAGLVLGIIFTALFVLLLLIGLSVTNR